MDRRRSHIQTEKMQEFKKSGDSISSPTKLLRCPQEGCSKVLTSSPGLRYHMRTHFGNDRPYSCNRCKKTFKSANGLKYHTEKTRCQLHIDVITTQETSLICHEDSIPDDEEIDIISMPSIDVQTWRNRAISEPSIINLSPTPYNTGMNTYDQEAIVNPLTQLAIIATGPHSPLLHNNQALADFHRASNSFNASIHSYAKPPQSRSSSVISRKRSLSFSGPESKYSCSSSSDDECRRGTSSGSEPSSSSDDNNNHTSQSWPLARWMCFISGTKVHLGNEWRTVNKDGIDEKCCTSDYAPQGLRLSTVLSKAPTLYLIFMPFNNGDSSALHVQCQIDHPFFVKEKGWCSYYPALTEEHYGIQCAKLDVNDVCLPPNHPDASFPMDAVAKFKRHQFTPDDTNAVLALSQMAMSRTESSSLEDLSHSYPDRMPHIKITKKGAFPANKAKRPMNAFMLFAKKFRVEYTHMFPGKDNRAISVLLGDRWKRMKNDERKCFSQEAKVLADQYKRMNPDCWKRKRCASECRFAHEVQHPANPFEYHDSITIFIAAKSWLLCIERMKRLNKL